MGDVATGNQTTALLSLHSSYQWQQGHMVCAQARMTNFNVCSVGLSSLKDVASSFARLCSSDSRDLCFCTAAKMKTWKGADGWQTNEAFCIFSNMTERSCLQRFCLQHFFSPSNRTGLAAGGETVYGTWSIVFWTGPECSNEAATGDPLQESAGSVLERETVGVCVFVVSADAGRNSKSVL